MLDRKCIGEESNPGLARSTNEPPMRQKIVKACWRAATNAKKNEKKWGSVGALNFGRAMEELVLSHGDTCTGI